MVLRSVIDRHRREVRNDDRLCVQRRQPDRHCVNQQPTSGILLAVTVGRLVRWFHLVGNPTQERFWVLSVCFFRGIPKEFEPMSAQAYRRHAADCLKISLVVADPEARLLLKQMAIAWASLAEQAENSPQTPQSAQQPRPAMGLDFDKLTPDEQRRVLDG
jgi:hypothetical protein